MERLSHHRGGAAGARNPTSILLLGAFVTASHESATNPIVTVLSLCFRVISWVRCAGTPLPWHKYLQQETKRGEKSLLKVPDTHINGPRLPYSEEPNGFSAAAWVTVTWAMGTTAWSCCIHQRVLPRASSSTALAGGQAHNARFALGMRFWKAQLSCCPLGVEEPLPHPPRCQHLQTTEELAVSKGSTSPSSPAKISWEFRKFRQAQSSVPLAPGSH